MLNETILGTSLMLIPDLIVSILDLLDSDTHTLCQCSLVNKEWLHFARYKLFKHLTIRLCVRPATHRLCHQCICHFADLVSSRHCTIPRSIHTLKLNGKDSEHLWSSLCSLVGNPGGMQRPAVILAVMKHFRSVEQLEMIKVNWFSPPRRSSRTIARFLSSVKSLTLNDVAFYAGPRGLLWMLDKMPSLDVLSMGKISWPARSGMPNNPSRFLVYSINAIPYCPLFWVPVYKMLSGALRLSEKMKPPTSHYALHKPLSRLSVEIRYHSMDEPWLPWLLAQAQMFNSITTLVVATLCTGDQEQVLVFQGLLDAAVALHSLRIYLRVFNRDEPTSPPTLIRHRALRSLEIHVSTFSHISPLIWIRWLKDLLHTATSSDLVAIQIVFELDASEVADIADSMAGIDECINGIPSLRLLVIFVGLSLSDQRSECEAEGILRTAFRQCDAKGILRVCLIQGSVVDFLEHEHRWIQAR